MNDYIIALDKDVAQVISRDWYKVHKRICDAIGDSRRAADGRAWQFAADPRGLLAGEGPRYIVVRGGHEVARAIAPIAIATEPVLEISLGTTVRFWLQASAKIRNNTDLAAARVDAAARSVSFPEEAAIDLLGRHGFADIAVDQVRQDAFRIRKHPIQRHPITKHSITAAGTATVTNLTLATKSLAEGVGRDRAFGFGLLIAEPVGSNH